MGRADVVKGGHDGRGRADQRLGFERRGLASGELHAAHLRRFQRDGHVDQHLADHVVRDGAERLCVSAVRHCEHEDLALARGPRVVATLHGVSSRGQLRRVSPCFRTVARADSDRVPGAGPAQRQGAS